MLFLHRGANATKERVLWNHVQASVFGGGGGGNVAEDATSLALCLCFVTKPGQMPKTGFQYRQLCLNLHLKCGNSSCSFLTSCFLMTLVCHLFTESTVRFSTYLELFVLPLLHQLCLEWSLIWSRGNSSYSISHRALSSRIQDWVNRALTVCERPWGTSGVCIYIGLFRAVGILGRAFLLGWVLRLQRSSCVPL